MIKTIKVKKQLRLDELIKYARLNNPSRTFSMKDDAGFTIKRITFVNGVIHCIPKNIPLDRTFTVEVEEEVTEDTEFRWLVEVNDIRVWTQKDASINDVKDRCTKTIHALINGKLELIWEAE